MSPVFVSRLPVSPTDDLPQSALAYMEKVGFLGTIAIPEEHSIAGSERILTAQGLYVTLDGIVGWDVYSWTKRSLPYMLDITDGYIEFHNHLMPPLGDFNRADEFIFAPDEDIPWVGSASHHLVVAPRTPEGTLLHSKPAEVEVDKTFTGSGMHAFDEDELELENSHIPDLLYLHQLVVNEDALHPSDGRCRVVAVRKTADHLWRRHTVLDIDYGACLRSVQTLEEHTKCRNFFTTLAVDVDLARYVVDKEDQYGPVSIGELPKPHRYLVSLGPSPIGKPPPKLYFYERIHTAKNCCVFEAMPWGYWSTGPEPIRMFPDFDADCVEQRAFIKETKHEVQYLGMSETFKFVWLHYHWTEDEWLLLRELRQCLKVAYESSPESTPEEVRSSIRRKRAESEDRELDDERRSAQRRRIV
ncbi:hypothetical protein BD414DRAFT_532253 [Trametes punicea]|nr:hypothetical protein BD414DRAFT_532253 [Trametes punicea]